ncbi:hypothetical protein D3C83_21630 [compost metagenome]
MLRVLRDHLLDRLLLRQQDRHDARALDHAARAHADHEVRPRRAGGFRRAHDGGARGVLVDFVEHAGKALAEELLHARDQRRLARHRAPADDERPPRPMAFHFVRQLVERVLPAVEPERVARCPEIVFIHKA